MEEALLEIVAAIKAGKKTLDATWLDKLVRRHNRAARDASRTVAKRRLLPYYLQVRADDPKRWRSWEIDEATEEQLLRLLKMKPRRTASGVATITVITKPWPCSSDCLYCPSDVRMPKSYLSDEPACQRAERNFFDPYLQVKARLHALEQMGHVTDKIELIVLGGTWSDYPEAYQLWFVRELFRALNDDRSYLGGPELPTVAHHGAPPDGHVPGSSASASHAGHAAQDTPVGKDAPPQAARPHQAPDLEPDVRPSEDDVPARTARYASYGIPSSEDELARAAAASQQRIDAGELSYNQAVRTRLDAHPWQLAAQMQVASWEDVEAAHHTNETAAHRVVGLVIETRPDLITTSSAHTMRRLGCTKIQMGIQSLDDATLAANGRHVTSSQIAHAFAVLRSYGFKIHVHFMVNLLGATPAADKADYRQLVSDPRFCPDEVKLYPCALVKSARLMASWQQGSWRPYTEDELLDVLVSDVLATPAYVRISRMIRDISSTDIVAGNKKTNLRQMVEQRLASRAGEVNEIRMREIAGASVQADDLQLACLPYQTATSDERFLQWVTPDGHIAGFCRLSLPLSPTTTAMIREVHVYGRVASLGASEQGAAQHTGLGKALVERACTLAREVGYTRIAVISSVGTRGYYRGLGFYDEGLYQLRDL